MQRGSNREMAAVDVEHRGVRLAERARSARPIPGAADLPAAEAPDDPTGSAASIIGMVVEQTRMADLMFEDLLRDIGVAAGPAPATP